MKRQGTKIRPIKSGVSLSNISRIPAALRLIRLYLSAWMKMIGLGEHVKPRRISLENVCHK